MLFFSENVPYKDALMPQVSRIGPVFHWQSDGNKIAEIQIYRARRGTFTLKHYFKSKCNPRILGSNNRLRDDSIYKIVFDNGVFLFVGFGKSCESRKVQ